MLPRVTTSVLALVLAILAAPVAQADWHGVGGQVSTSNASGGPTTTDVGGVAWVAWSGGNEGGSSGIHVKRWNGSSWELVGGVLNVNAAGTVGPPSIANIGGVPYVAWYEKDGAGPDQVRVARWSGSAWVAVGGSLLGVGAVVAMPEDVKIASVGGVPYVTWSQQAMTMAVFEVHVKHWDGSIWTGDKGALNRGSLDAYHPSIADIGGTAEVAFEQVQSGGGPWRSTSWRRACRLGRRWERVWHRVRRTARPTPIPTRRSSRSRVSPRWYGCRRGRAATPSCSARGTGRHGRLAAEASRRTCPRSSRRRSRSSAASRTSRGSRTSTPPTSASPRWRTTRGGRL